MSLFLASASPRRKALLEQVGFRFDVLAVNIDETPHENEHPESYVKRMAQDKALEASHILRQRLGIGSGQHHVLLASDTSVVLGHTILGKPNDRLHFIDMMQQLSGRSHQVLTSVCVRRAAPSTDPEASVKATSKASAKAMTEKVVVETTITEKTIIVATKVYFKTLSQDEIRSYWNTDEPIDKAGGYGIQGRGALFVERVEGSYSNVVGLPLKETAELLVEFQISPWDES